MDLTTPLTYVKGVGPGRAAMLEAKGLLTVEDLQEHLQIGRSLAYQLARKLGIRVGNGRLLRVPRERIAEMMTVTQ